MEWINSLVALFGVALGWLFSQCSEYFKDRKADKKKLKKLLFYLLELRYLLFKELNFDRAIQNAVQILKEKAEELVGESLSSEDFLFDSMVNTLKENYNNSEEISSIENNIDNIILELSEIDPVFAYELSGRYKIKERISKYNEYLTSYNYILEGAPNQIKDFVNQPFSNSELLEEIDEFMYKIGKRISYKTVKDIKDKLLIQSETFDRNSIEEFVVDYIEKIKALVPINEK